MERTPGLAIAAVVVLATTATHAAASLGRLTFTITKGTVSCGGPALSPPPLPPFSGGVDNPDRTKRSDLGLGCLYSAAVVRACSVGRRSRTAGDPCSA
jgi:hypothetical protein